jgi:hypothetical protein
VAFPITGTPANGRLFDGNSRPHNGGRHEASGARVVAPREQTAGPVNSPIRMAVTHRARAVPLVGKPSDAVIREGSRGRRVQVMEQQPTVPRRDVNWIFCPPRQARSKGKRGRLLGR